MKGTRSFISVFFAAMLLVGGYSIVGAAPDQPSPGTGGPSGGIIADARWVKDQAGKWYLGVTLEVPQTPKETFDKFAGANCSLFLSFGQTSDRTEFRLMKIIDRQGKMQARFGPYHDRKLTMGEWQLKLAITKGSRVLANTKISTTLGTEADVRAAKEEDGAWFREKMRQLKYLYDSIEKGDKEKGLLGAEDLIEEREKTDPSRDSKLDSEWVGRIFAWRDAQLGRLAPIFNDVGRRYEDGRIVGLLHPHSATQFKYIHPKLVFLVNEYVNDLSWQDIRDSAAAAAAEEAAAAGGSGRGAEDGAGGRGEAERPAAEKEKEKKKEIHTAKEALAERREKIAAGMRGYDYEARREGLRYAIEVAFMKIEIEIGSISETTIGALWQDVDLVVQMEAAATGEYATCQPGPPAAAVPADKWKDWPGGWARWVVETPKVFDKYKGSAKENILAQDQEILRKITDAIEAFKSLRDLYLSDLYTKFSVPDDARDKLAVAADASIEEVKKRFDGLMAQVLAFIEKERAERREGLEKIGKELKDLAKSIKDQFAGPDPATVFNPEGSNPFLSQWDGRLAVALNKINEAENYKDAKLFFPAADEITRMIHRQLSALEASMIRYYSTPAHGAIVNKAAIKKEVDANARACRESFERLDKELARQRIETISSTLK